LAAAKVLVAWVTAVVVEMVVASAERVGDERHV